MARRSRRSRTAIANLGICAVKTGGKKPRLETVKEDSPERSKPSTFPALPKSLVDGILNYLWDEKLALSSCSLVTRSWNATSRGLLFSTVPIRGVVGKRGFHSFMLFLDASPQISPHIRTLVITGSISEDTRTPSGPTILPPQAIRLALSKLQNLRILELHDIQLSAFSTGQSIPSPQCFVLDRLVLNRISFQPPVLFGTSPSTLLNHIHSQSPVSVSSKVQSPATWLSGLQLLIDLLQMFSKVRELDLDEIMLASPIRGKTLIIEEQLGKVKVHSHLEIESLELGSSSVNGLLLRLLCQTSSMHALRSISMSYSHTHELESLGIILSADRSHLKYVHIDISSWDDILQDQTNPINKPTLNFSTCSSLESFVISNVQVLPDILRNHLIWSYILDIMHHLPPSLLHLKMSLNIESEALVNTVGQLDWSRLMTILDSLPNLQTLTFGFQHHSSDYNDLLQAWHNWELAGTIRMALQTYRRQDILCFE